MTDAGRRMGIWPFVLFAIGALLVSPLIGPVTVDLAAAIDGMGNPAASEAATIFWVLRVPRVVLAALTGAGLAVAGAVFQALLRNPLATPYTLGVSGGGALGAVIAIKLGLGVLWFGISPVSIGAFIGAAAAMALVWKLAASRGHMPTAILLLSGVAVTFIASAMILFVHYLADSTQSLQMVRWLMGGLDVVGWRETLAAAPVWILGMVLLMIHARTLDQLAVGDFLAYSRGVDVSRVQKLLYLSASLVVGAVVAAAGPIGFVGLIVPHAVRFLCGPGHRRLMPASALAGAGFLALADAAARTILAPAELPVGVLTALIGGPFFIMLLFREKKRYAP